MPSSLLATPYPTAVEWRQLVQQFQPDAIAQRFLLAHIPFVFRDEPMKYALFRVAVADAFEVEPFAVFIVGSAMAGRSLKGSNIDKSYGPASDIDTLIVSKELFDSYSALSIEWQREATKPEARQGGRPTFQPLDPNETKYLYWLADSGWRGIWRPDSLPSEAKARQDFFTKFHRVSLHTLGLQLSEDTVAKVSGRIARSFDAAVQDFAGSIARLKKEFEEQPIK